MKVCTEKKRLKAIKIRYRLFSTKCRCCGKKYKKEKMWSVKRWSVDKKVVEWNYCKNCMHSAEDVLHEIDTDGVPFGIAYIDDFVYFEKKDYSKVIAATIKC